jgi:hypothetical protein
MKDLFTTFTPQGKENIKLFPHVKHHNPTVTGKKPLCIKYQCKGKCRVGCPQSHVKLSSLSAKVKTMISDAFKKAYACHDPPNDAPRKTTIDPLSSLLCSLAKTTSSASSPNRRESTGRRSARISQLQAAGTLSLLSPNSVSNLPPRAIKGQRSTKDPGPTNTARQKESAEYQRLLRRQLRARRADSPPGRIAQRPT